MYLVLRFIQRNGVIIIDFFREDFPKSKVFMTQEKKWNVKSISRPEVLRRYMVSRKRFSI